MQEFIPTSKVNEHTWNDKYPYACIKRMHFTWELYICCILSLL